MSTTETPFAVALRRQIRKFIRDVRADDTVAMSIDNLRQVVRPPSSSLDGAPRGTNAAYDYAELFRDVCRTDPIIASFTRSFDATEEFRLLSERDELRRQLDFATSEYHRGKEARRDAQRELSAALDELRQRTTERDLARAALARIVARDGDCIRQDQWFELRDVARVALAPTT